MTPNIALFPLIIKKSNVKEGASGSCLAEAVCYVRHVHKQRLPHLIPLNNTPRK